MPRQASVLSLKQPALRWHANWRRRRAPVAELAAGKQALESSLAATKASLQACEDKLVSAEVSARPEICRLVSRQCQTS